MAVLDLQGMQEQPTGKRAAGRGNHSGASKQCGGNEFSSLSLLLCG